VGAFDAGKVSTGLTHATPGEMKSLRSSADKMALIFKLYRNTGARRNAQLPLIADMGE
jgi:hypothetical protein